MTVNVNKIDIKKLEEHATNIRKLTIESIYRVGSGHAGPSLSMTDLVTTLLFNEMNWEEYKGEDWRDTNIPRDRFILSKGHAVPSWYSALAEGGFIPKEDLYTLRDIDSPHQGHPDRTRFPYIDASTGALGQGLSVAIGRAIAGKLKKDPYRVYCIIGDGESQEGQVWEAAIFAGNKSIDNLLCILDYNRSQGDGSVDEIMPLDPLAEKWKAFGWNVLEIDGHNITEITKAYGKARETKGTPTIIIANTKKGYLRDGEIFMGGAHAGKINYFKPFHISNRILLIFS